MHVRYDSERAGPHAPFKHFFGAIVSPHTSRRDSRDPVLRALPPHSAAIGVGVSHTSTNPEVHRRRVLLFSHLILGVAITLI
jgi:hypothetical protein